MIYPILLCAGAIALVCYIREKLRAYSLKAVYLKTLVSALFLAVGVTGAFRCAGAGKESLLCPFVLMGLLFGLLGDIWLDLKYVFPEKNESFTKATGWITTCVKFVAGITLEIYLIQYIFIHHLSSLPFPVNFVVTTGAILIAAWLVHFITVRIQKPLGKALRIE